MRILQNSELADGVILNDGETGEIPAPNEVHITSINVSHAVMQWFPNVGRRLRGYQAVGGQNSVQAVWVKKEPTRVWVEKENGGKHKDMEMYGDIVNGILHDVNRLLCANLM